MLLLLQVQVRVLSEKFESEQFIKWIVMYILEKEPLRKHTFYKYNGKHEDMLLVHLHPGLWLVFPSTQLKFELSMLRGN